VNSYLSVEEAAYIVNDSRSRVVITSAARAPIALELPALCPEVERWVITDGKSDARFESWDETIATRPTDHVADEKHGMAMLYSSGTTGRPKGILRPLPDAHPGDNLFATQGLTALWQLREGMIYLSPAPLYHSAPQGNMALALRLGATCIVMEHFEATHFLDLVGTYRVTHSQVVPTMFSRMLKLPEHMRNAADVSSLEVVIHAAAPCPIPVKAEMISWFGPILLEYYAATEGNGFTVCD
jgi:long-chain acyl-CoA synthetase